MTFYFDTGSRTLKCQTGTVPTDEQWWCWLLSCEFCLYDISSTLNN